VNKNTEPKKKIDNISKLQKTDQVYKHCHKKIKTDNMAIYNINWEENEFTNLHVSSYSFTMQGLRTMLGTYNALATIKLSSIVAIKR
jgi:hypothetical protein